MPDDVKTEHNGVTLTFKEIGHKYSDNIGTKYMSVTTLVGKGFKPFEADKIAEMQAKKSGKTKEEILFEWKETARIGTRTHNYAEYYIKNNKIKDIEPESDVEKERFNKSVRIIDNIIQLYKPEQVESEKTIFSPSFRISGSIDMLVKVNDLSYLIFDWKCLKKDIDKVGWNGQKGIILPTINIEDARYWHYALQLQIYENILKSEGYIDGNASVNKSLIVWNGTEFKIEPIPYVPEAWALMCWRNKLN